MNGMAQQGVMADLDIILISIMLRDCSIVGIDDWIKQCSDVFELLQKGNFVIAYLIPPKGFVELHGWNLSEK